MLYRFIVLGLLCAITAHAEINVLALAGSTREGSYNKLLVKEAAQIAQAAGAYVKVIDLKDYPIPFFDEDLETLTGLPPKAQELRQLFVQSQLIIIASPDYNASVSAVLKNAIDWISRDDVGDLSIDAFTGKKFVLLSASPGKKGGAKGLLHLKDIVLEIGGNLFPEQFSLPSASRAFDDKGLLKDPGQKSALQELILKAIQN